MVARIAIAVVLGASACSLDASAQGAPERVQLAAAPHPIVAVPLTVPAQPRSVVHCRVTARMPGDSAERDVGTRTLEARVVSVDGRQAVQRVIIFSTSRGTVVDSTLTFVDGLVPVSESSHQPTKVMRLAFDGAHVTGSVAPTDSAAHAIDQQVGVPVFNSTDVDLIVSALPLAQGFRTVLPTYVYETGGLEQDTVTVTGTELVQGPAGPRRAWVAHVDGRMAHITYWIDAETRDVLMGEFRPSSTRMVIRFMQI